MDAYDSFDNFTSSFLLLSFCKQNNPTEKNTKNNLQENSKDMKTIANH